MSTPLDMALEKLKNCWPSLKAALCRHPPTLRAARTALKVDLAAPINLKARLINN